MGDAFKPLDNISGAADNILDAVFIVGAVVVVVVVGNGGNVGKVGNVGNVGKVGHVKPSVVNVSSAGGTSLLISHIFQGMENLET